MFAHNWHRRSVPVPDPMLEVQFLDRGTANSVRGPGLALSEIKTRERNSGFAGSRVALLLYSQPGHRQNRSPRARSSRQALASSIRRIGAVPGAGSSAARHKRRRPATGRDDRVPDGSGKRATSGQIYRAILGKGVEVRGNNPSAVVAAQLTACGAVFDHIKREGYGLREWSNGDAPPKNRSASNRKEPPRRPGNAPTAEINPVCAPAATADRCRMFRRYEPKP
jgi:hypothetical protein